MLPSHHWYGSFPAGSSSPRWSRWRVVLFARRVTFLVRLLLKGKPAARWDQLPTRVGKVLVYVFGQARLIGGDFWPGLMHATIFWGFIVLTLGTIEFFGKGVTESFFLPFMSDTGAFLVLQDLFSVLVIAAVSYAAFRRIVTRPRRLTLSAEGLVILSLIFGLMVSDLVADAARIVLAPAPSDHWQFAGQRPRGGARRPAPRRGRGDLPRGVVAARGACSWASWCWLPYSKHLHVLAAPLNVFFAHARAEGAVPDGGPRERGDVRGRGDHRVHLEGSLRHVQLHRVRPLHVALPGQHERQGARPEDADPAPAGAPHRGGARLVAGPATERRRARDGTARRSSATSSTTTCSGPARRAAGAWTPARSSSSTCRRSWTCGASSCSPSRASRPSCSRRSATSRPTATRGRCPGRRARTGPPTWASASWRRSARPSTSTGSAATAPSTSATRRSRARFVKLLQAARVDFAILGNEEQLHRRAGAAAGPRVPVPDAGPGQRRDAQAVPVPDHRHRVPALLQYASRTSTRSSTATSG